MDLKIYQVITIGMDRGNLWTSVRKVRAKSFNEALKLAQYGVLETVKVMSHSVMIVPEVKP